MQGRVEGLLIQVRPGGAEDLAVGVADQNGRVCQQDDGVDVVDKRLIREAPALGQSGVGVAGDKAGVSVQGGLDLLELVAVGEGKKPHAQQHHT